ncbi:AcrR family transcriptional regulator [Okibacterium sp. HSC-33S16]|uniref:TetR/AcrR family transcriptional regulator n=1 Tax=Okibacterium sp. HSC-33S16 TaxID=2910965 RepID=UPI00209E957B|nr:TetR/AcrR family transcriptional regulator [Okibacterium sp. HSC-33S16]MCP2030061.1 AcrR family transcriptional regulator [Okibacterium sp. HSC-33S16]
MMTKAESTRGKRGPYAKSADRRQAIVEAAHTVFAAQGYVGGSLQDVADRVGMSQTSLLHYFPSKRELLLAVLNWRDSITGDGQTPPDPTETFSESILRQARFNEKIPGVIELYAVLCAESLTDDHPGRAYFCERFDTLRATYFADFTRLAEKGRLRPGVDPARAAASLIALWDGIQTQWLLDPEGIDMAACLRDYLSLIILEEPDENTVA